MSLLNQFIANIFDIYPTSSFIDQFISDNNFNLEKVLSHPFLNHTLSYSYVWNLIFKNYPTKRDFQNYLNVNKYLPSANVELDNKCLEKMLNSFFILKLGLLNNINTQEIAKQFEAFYKELNNTNFKLNLLYEKLSYRFNSTEVYNNTNIFMSFSKIIKNYKPIIDVADPTYNFISKNYNDTIEFVEKDNIYMNDIEKVQYILFKDNHFLMKLLSNIVIMIDGPITDSHLELIIDNYIKVEDKHVVLLNYKGDIWDPTYVFQVPENLYKILPSICKQFLLISNKAYPIYNSLSLKRENGIYYLQDDLIKNVENIKITNTFDRYIISNIKHNEIPTKINKYLIINPVKINLNLDIKSEKLRVYCGPNTQINSDKYIIIKDTKEVIDIVIDFKNELDILPFMVNGAIPILKTKNIYVQDNITGFYITDTDNLDDFISKFQDIIINRIRKNNQKFRILTDPFCNSVYWKYHIEGGCPMRSISPKNGILLYLNFIILYFCKKIKEINNIEKCNNESLNKVVLIDNRQNPLSVISILFTMSNLNSNWSPIINTSKKGYEFYKTYLQDIVQINHLKELDASKFHIDIYNNILKSEDFWDSISGKKCLIIQDDGILLRKGIEKYEEYDYIGASWADCVSNEYIKNNITKDLVGNGGFSLRNVEKMKEVIKNGVKDKTWLFFKNITQIPEDVYFVHGLKKLEANMPKYEVGTTFASEEICNYSSIGIHKMWSYHMGELVQTYFNKVLAE
jgi:hypothetical protein